MASPSANNHPPYVTSKLIETTHGFFGRRGGVSNGYFESLNTGFAVGDDIRNATDNCARVAAAMGVEPSKRLHLIQVHGTICHVIDKQRWTPTDAPDGDALVTDKPGICLSVLSADCAPVLFSGNGVIGAAHAGWGGAVKGVLESTLDAMRKLGAKDITAAIGPCIGPESYEVSAGFEKPFLTEDQNAAQFFRTGEGADKLFFDLPAYCAFRLKRAGVAQVDIIGHDTAALEEAYFSHRRSTKRGEPKRGLQMSTIVLKG